MLSFIHLKRLVALFLCSVLVGLPAVPLQAAMLSTEQVIAKQSGSSNSDTLRATLAREDVHQQLVELGVDPQRAEQRIAKLSDSQIAQLNQRLEELPAGGDALGLIVLIFLVFVITDAVGATDIFPFVHPVNK